MEIKEESQNNLMTPHAPMGPKAVGLGELAAQRLLPLAVQAYEDLLVNAKSEKVRLEAANAVTELAGARQRGPSSVGLTFNMPPEYLRKALGAMVRLGPEDGEPSDAIVADAEVLS